MNTASPAKLKDGTWGIRAEGTLVPGQAVMVTTKSGKSWETVVSRIVWSGNGVCIATTVARATPAPAARGGYSRRTGCSCGSREDDPRASDCASCRHDY